MERMKGYLPEDLIIEIFYLLPVVSLLQCSLVCKSWRAIISGREFVKTHSYLSQIMAHKKASVLMLTYCHDQFRGLCDQSSPDFDYYLLDPRYYIVIGSCNGIICLKDDKFFHLLNPATKQGKRLPIFPKIKEDLTHAKPLVKLAFGLDTISDDYKILKFTCPTITSNVVPVVQLYSTNTGSWKEIYVHDTSISEVLCYPFLQLGPVIKGALYMCHKKQLVSFNLHSEMFSVVAFPNSMLRYSVVLDFEDSVAVISESVGEGSGISLWTLDDIPGKISWTKKFFVRDDIDWVYSYLGGGLLYGRRMPWGNMHDLSNSSPEILYAYIKKKFKHPIENPGAVLKYRETLVSIEGFHPVRKMVDWFKPRVEQVSQGNASGSN